MPKVRRNAFNSGELDPKLLGRSDIEQYRNGLKTGTNVVLIPQGGCKRRPGLKYLASIGADARLASFRFTTEQSYLLAMLNQRIDVYEDDAKVTQVVSPWTSAQVDELEWDQTADTMVLCHQDVAPYRLLRQTASADPIVTDGSTTTVVVRVPAHGLSDGDKVGLAGVDAAVGGVPASELNTSHSITEIDGALGSNPVTTSAASTTVQVTITGHPFATGERVTLAGLTATDGIPTAELNRIQTITDVPDANTVEFEVETSATAGTTGGGSSGTWDAPDKFNITVTTTSTSSASGGGSSVKCWSLTTVPLENLPQFDYEDAQSPARSDERQILLFDSFASGDRFRLVLDGQRTEKISYDSNTDLMAQRLQDYLRLLSLDFRTPIGTFDSRTPTADGIVVEYFETVGSTVKYYVKFQDQAGKINWPAIDPIVTESNSGTLTVTEDQTGGETTEDVISATRGWPRAVAFHQGRLWFGGLKARPSTVIASKVDDYFDFDPGDALDSEGIDATGQFEPILHLLSGRRLFMFTARSEVLIQGETGSGAITPANISFEQVYTTGSTGVRPVFIGSRPIFVDRTNRALRMVEFDPVGVDTEQFNAKELSILAQHLINTPLDMAVLRNTDGDYVYTVMTDGTLAVLNVNLEQGVNGFTKFTTDGTFLAVAEVADSMYALVQRTINAATVYYLEKFDPAYYTDAGYQATASATSSWSGLDHLEAETVDVRGEIDSAAGYATLDQETVASGAITTAVADFATDVTGIEVGIPFTPTIEPMPPAIERKVRKLGAVLDLLDSRAVKVDGFSISDVTQAGITQVPPALTSGMKRVRLRGYSERPTVTITQSEPQPMTLRWIEMEVAA